MSMPTPSAMFDTDQLVINMGPQHPSTHGVLRLVLRLDGERVIDADVVIGYLHRGIEKLCEARDWTQIVLITDRMDYVAAATNNLGYCETVEKLLQLEVPRRARYLRTILSELQRLASHLVWLGTHAMDIGAVTVFLYCLRERELVLDLFEEYCGARLTYNAMRVGGLPQDIPPGWDREGRGALPGHRGEDQRLRDAADAEPDLAGAHPGRGRHLGARCDRDGLLRARRCAPRASCATSARTSPTPRTTSSSSTSRSGPPATPTIATWFASRSSGSRSGSSARRFDGLPEGPVIGKVPRLIKPPAGETYHAIEAPKGELGFFIVSDGKSLSPYRLRVRPPSFCNLQVLPQLVRGHLVADVVALIGTIDIVLGEVDRLIATDHRHRPARQDRHPVCGPAHGGRLHRAARAQGPGLGAGAARPDARGPSRHPPAGRRRPQAGDQGGHHPGARRQVDLHAGADPRPRAGADRLCGHPVRRQARLFGLDDPAAHHGHQRRPALHRVGLLDRRLRADPRGLGLQQQIPAALEPAGVGPAHQLRGRRDDDAREHDPRCRAR